jgi:hypothetical protein
LERTD